MQDSRKRQLEVDLDALEVRMEERLLRAARTQIESARLADEATREVEASEWRKEIAALRKELHAVVVDTEGGRQCEAAEQRRRARAERGQAMLEAFQRNDVQEIERFGLSTLDVDFTQKDASGMTCLHHAARGVRLEVVCQIIEKEPHLADEVTFVTRNPASWTALICCADVPREKNDAGQLRHARTMRRLAQAMSPERLEHFTHFGTSALHISVSRCHNQALAYILPIFLEKLGKQRLETLLNAQVGKHHLGCYDIACKTSLDPERQLLGLVRTFGAKPQAAPPDNWKKTDDIMKTRAMTIPGQTTNMVDGPATFLELLHLSVWPLALSLFPASGLVIPFAAAPGLHLASGLVSHATRNDNSNKARECCQEKSEKILFSTPFSPFFYFVETNMQGKVTYM